MSGIPDVEGPGLLHLAPQEAPGKSGGPAARRPWLEGTAGSATGREAGLWRHLDLCQEEEQSPLPRLGQST